MLRSTEELEENQHLIACCNDNTCTAQHAAERRHRAGGSTGSGRTQTPLSPTGKGAKRNEFARGAPPAPPQLCKEKAELQNESPWSASPRAPQTFAPRRRFRRRSAAFLPGLFFSFPPFHVSGSDTGSEGRRKEKREKNRQQTEAKREMKSDSSAKAAVAGRQAA